AAAFHLITHAFFKALLFLGSGSVIHGMEHGVLHTNDEVDPQNMMNMGGLRKKMPITFWTFLIGGFALSGFPFVTAGFWSKDEILSEAFGNMHWVVFTTLALAALLTAFYTMRQITLTFLGEPRSKAAEHAQETPWTMTFPLVVLAFFAVSAGWVGIPEHFPLLGGILPNWFHSFVGSTLLEEPEATAFHYIPLLTSLVVALGGLWLGWTVYKKIKAGDKDPLEEWLGVIYPVLKNKYYVDEFYDVVFIKPAIWFSEVFTYLWLDRKIIDGILHTIANIAYQLGSIFRNYFDKPIVNGSGDLVANVTKSSGRSLRVIQTGRVQQYMIMALFGFITISGLMFYLIQRLILR
ncbi:MAG: proton-conducting transporter membrane subunit, partial [Anaerolineales bacterium]